MSKHREEDRKKSKKERQNIAQTLDQRKLGLPGIDPQSAAGGTPIRERGGVNVIVPKREATELAARGKLGTEEGDVVRRQEEIGAATADLKAVAEGENVFGDIVHKPVISPEQEDLSVIARIIRGTIPGLDKVKIAGPLNVGNVLDLLGKKKEPISQAEITMIAADIKEGVKAQTLIEIEFTIVETENGLREIGLMDIPPTQLEPVTEKVLAAGPVAGAIVGQAFIGPIAEFVGTDGQIRSLELALSQYNEMITIPARSLDAGLSPSAAFEKYNRMEEGLNSLESLLRQAALTSPKVAISLRGRGVDARLLKLKEKLQEGRRDVLFKMTQERFGEVDIPTSISFLRSLQR